MEEYQLVFVLWLAKFAVFCVVALFVLSGFDRWWRKARAKNASPTMTSPIGTACRRTV